LKTEWRAKAAHGARTSRLNQFTHANRALGKENPATYWTRNVSKPLHLRAEPWLDAPVVALSAAAFLPLVAVEAIVCNVLANEAGWVVFSLGQVHGCSRNGAFGVDHGSIDVDVDWIVFSARQWGCYTILLVQIHGGQCYCS